MRQERGELQAPGDGEGEREVEDRHRGVDTEYAARFPDPIWTATSLSHPHLPDLIVHLGTPDSC